MVDNIWLLIAHRRSQSRVTAVVIDLMVSICRVVFTNFHVLKSRTLQSCSRAFHPACVIMVH